ncbi:MAG: hypothetical protein JWL98_157 [Xanthomonadaceae bacterium]|nr:hypothetical protein [Xanthomonadaceae bacterium]
MSDHLSVQPFFHAATGTWSYVVDNSRDAVVIDPVLDYEAASGRVKTDSVGALLEHVRSHGLKVHYILETHAHADHLSAGAFVRTQTSAQLAIGRGIRSVQAHFADVFLLSGDDPSLVEAFDRLLDDGDVIQAGALRISVMATPGHTADGISYRIDNHVFIGDTLFAPDVGTARCDFPGGNVEQLYASIRSLHALPDDTMLWLCHDYPPAGRAPLAGISVAESRQDNRMLRGVTTLAEFSAARTARDATLKTPVLLYPSLQVNIRGGTLPPAVNGHIYVQTPAHLVAPADGVEHKPAL